MIRVKAPEARVPLGVGVVGGEGQREAAAGEGDQGGVHAGLQLLQVLLPTQNRNKLPVGEDLGTEPEGRTHNLQVTGSALAPR